MAKSFDAASIAGEVNEIGHGYRASLFHPNFGNEVVNGQVVIDRAGLRFESESVQLVVPADRLELQWQREQGRICFIDSANPEQLIYTFEEGFLNNTMIPQVRAVRDQIVDSRSRWELIRRFRVLGYFVAGCVLITCLFSWGTGFMVRSLARKVPADWEKSFGEASLAEIKGDVSASQFSNQVVRLTTLAEPLLKVLPPEERHVTFYIVQDSDPNAFAFPGGYVVVNSALLELADRPEEVLGVLAHELAHVTQRHYAQHMISAAGPLVLFGVFFHSRNGVVNLLGQGSGLMIAQGFSQRFETEADEIGWEYLTKANIDPRGMISMFRKFKTLEKDKTEITHAFDSHPALDKRIRNLESKWKKLPDKSKSGFLELHGMDWLRAGSATPSHSN